MPPEPTPRPHATPAVPARATPTAGQPATKPGGKHRKAMPAHPRVGVQPSVPSGRLGARSEQHARRANHQAEGGENPHHLDPETGLPTPRTPIA